MYCIITLTWSLLGTFIFCHILSIKWKKLDRLDKMTFNMLWSLHRIYVANGYMNYKFSIIRHAVVFALSSIAIYNLTTQWIISVITLINLLYTALPIFRYISSKKELTDSLFSPIKASIYVVIFCCITVALLYVLVLVKP